MWGPSSGYIGSSDPSGSITNIAQYIEDYIDLVENIPNEIARHVSRLHEYNNRYYQLLDKLERTWESLANCSNSILANGGGQLNGVGTKTTCSSLTPSTSTSSSKILSTLSSSLSSPSLTSSSSLASKNETKLSTNNSTSSPSTSPSPTKASSSSTTISSTTSTSAPSTTTTTTSTPLNTAATTTAAPTASLTTKASGNCSNNPDPNCLKESGLKVDQNSGNGSDHKTESSNSKLMDQRKGLRAVYGLQKCLIEIQEISDEKLFIVQSILDQLDGKARQLDYDYRSVTVGTLANNLNSNSSKGLSSILGTDEDSKNHISDSNGISNNIDSGGGSGGGKGGEITSTKESGSSSVNGLNSSQLNNCTSLANKRSSSRRNLSSKQEISNGEITSSHKKGVKRGGGGVKGNSKDSIKRNKSSKEVLNTSPQPLYEDTPIDPDEPTYCSCEQVSYGEMICCDNPQCQIEWFHFACVSLTTKPKGRWFCPNCRGDRSNIPKK